MGKYIGSGFKQFCVELISRGEWGPVLVFGLLLTVLGGCASAEVTPPKEYSKVDKARMIIEIANGSLAEGDATGALQSLAQAETIESELPELHHSRALAFYAKNDLNSAIQSAFRAVKLKPDYADGNNTLGKLLMDAGRNEEAEKPLQIAGNNALYREAYKALTNLGILNYRAGQFGVARKYFERAIADAPVLACVAYYYRGHLDLKDSNLKEAVNDYSKATKKVCAQFAEAYLALGLAYEQDRQYPQARRTFLDIQKRYPNTKLAEKALEQLRFLP
jgi:Tfp pilus assembly protein PilF